MSLPFNVYVDTSRVGSGAILTQIQNGREVVISYWSRSLTAPQKSWGVTELELLGACTVINTAFRPYLHGQRFTLFTDHLSLKWLDTLGSNGKGNRRLLSMALKLQGYIFDVVHKAGKDFHIVDAPSRAPLPFNHPATLPLYPPVAFDPIKRDYSPTPVYAMAPAQPAARSTALSYSSTPLSSACAASLSSPTASKPPCNQCTVPLSHAQPLHLDCCASCALSAHPAPPPTVRARAPTPCSPSALRPSTLKSSIRTLHHGAQHSGSSALKRVTIKDDPVSSEHTYSLDAAARRPRFARRRAHSRISSAQSDTTFNGTRTYSAYTAHQALASISIAADPSAEIDLLLDAGANPQALANIQRQDHSLKCYFDAIESQSNSTTRKLAQKIDSVAANMYLDEHGRLIKRYYPSNHANRSMRRLLVIPKPLRQGLIDAIHASSDSGHFMVNVTSERLLLNYWWPNLDAQVRTVLATCAICQHRAAHSRRLGLSAGTPLPTRKFQMWQVDLSGDLRESSEGFNCFVIFTCVLTGWSVTVPLTDGKTRTIAAAFNAHILKMYSTPEYITSDAGSNITAKAMKALYDILKIDYHINAAYIKNGTAYVERRFRTLWDRLAKIKPSDVPHSTWPRYLASATHAANCAYSSTRQASAFELVFGVTPRHPIDNIFKPLSR